ncbi:MAG: zf-HC2 domain-containing protein [Planctomycetota bacterium]|jgi:predicted anti-sigma-YlaC factor YlaD
MACEDYKDLMMGYLDEELSAEQIRSFEEHLTGCKQCSSQLQEFRQLKAITDQMTLIEPEDRLWQQYWDGIYNRVERGIGWIIFSVAAILLTIYGGFKAIEALITDPTVGLLLKIAMLVLLVGLAILFVSVLRERIFFWTKDRYKDVRR